MVKKVQDPREPSREERAQHEDPLDLPNLVPALRAWSREADVVLGGCPRGALGLLVFFGREDDPLKTMAVLVAKERTSKMVLSVAVHRKRAGAHIAKRVAG